MAGREVRVAILGDSRDFSRAVSNANRDAGRLHGAFSKAGSGIATLAKGAALGVGALAVGGVALAKGFIEAAEESAQVTAQTAAVIKSMGGAANVSAEQVSKLSTALSMKSGVDDELIQSGANIMMTFGKVRNEVGKGNDIFDRATAAALDMSVALDQDMKSSVVMIGKALNDPIKGLTAMGKAGIQFTDQQKKQIKWLVENGKGLKAQKIIMGELERQFGGSAEAQATASNKLRVAWGNIQEELGARLLPIFEKVAMWLADKLPGAIAKVTRVIGPLIGAAKQIFGILIERDFKGGGPFAEDSPFIGKVFEVRDAVARFVERVQEFMPRLVAAFQTAVAFVQAHWPEIQRVISETIDVIVTVVSGAVDVITTLWDNFGNNILEFVQRVWPNIQQVIGGALEVIRGIVTTVTALIKGDWATVWEGIKGILSGAWEAIQGIVKGALEVVRTVLGAGLEVLGSMFKSAWEGIVGWFWSIPSRVGEIASRIWEALKSGLKAAVDWILEQIDRMLGPLDEALGKLAGVKDFLVGGVDWESKLKNAGLTSKAQGGTVPGALGQPRMILAHGGEQVLTHGQQMRSGGGGGTMNIYITTAADPQAVVEAIKRYTRSNGPLPSALVA